MRRMVREGERERKAERASGGIRRRSQSDVNCGARLLTSNKIRRGKPPVRATFAADSQLYSGLNGQTAHP